MPRKTQSHQIIVYPLVVILSSRRLDQVTTGMPVEERLQAYVTFFTGVIFSTVWADDIHGVWHFYHLLSVSPTLNLHFGLGP